METHLRAPDAFLPHACLCLAARDTLEPSTDCTNLQQIPSLNKQGKRHNNKDPFNTAYFQVTAETVLLMTVNIVVLQQQSDSNMLVLLQRANQET